MCALKAIEFITKDNKTSIKLTFVEILTSSLVVSFSFCSVILVSYHFSYNFQVWFGRWSNFTKQSREVTVLYVKNRPRKHIKMGK
jgi:hypothetical protein